MEKDIVNDKELYSYFVQRNQTLCEENFDYLTVNPEIKKLLNDYLANLLLHKPDDVFKFTKHYFSILSEKPNYDKFLVIVGPTGVGKTRLINTLMNEYPNQFEIAKKHTTNYNKSPNYINISKEKFIDFIHSKEIIEYDYDGEDYIGTCASEVSKIQKEGKICLIEIDIKGAKYIYDTNFPANYIGILSSSYEVLRERLRTYIIDGKKLNTETITSILEVCKEEIDEIKQSSFFTNIIVNDIYESSYQTFKNCVLTIYPYFKTYHEEIKELSLEKRKNIELIKERMEKSSL